MRVVEIFKSIDGEGIRAGFPVTFIRLAGCNLKCSYCDSQYACQNVLSYPDMSIEQIVRKVYELGCKRITLTGGEPLIHEDAESLIRILYDLDFEVNVETNGSQDIRRYVNYKNIIITLDYKCPTSDMESKMALYNLPHLRETDVLKFVVGSKEDLDVCRRISKFTRAQVFISPVFGKIEPKEIVEYMLENDMYNCRIQLQLHKYIWDPNERGV